MARAGLLALALAGCGRLGFDGAPIDDTTPAGDGPHGDVTPSSCAYLLCEDFEAPALDTSLWTADPAVTRDTSVARGGNASGRMHIDARAPNQAASATLAESRTLGSSRELWIRGWFRLSALPAAMNELEVIGLARSSSSASVHAVYVRASQIGFALNTGISVSTNVTVPLDTWFCLVWHVRLASSEGAMDLTGDLFSGPAIAGGNTETMPPLSVLRLGAQFTSENVTTAQPAIDLWLDDLIVHSAPLTCAD